MNRMPPKDDYNSIPMPDGFWPSTAPSDLAPLAEERFALQPRPRRKPQLPVLTSDAHVWLARLPPQYQPLNTAHRHPHIVNELSSRWSRPEDLPAFFSELLISNRPGREGFSFDVIAEMADLQGMVEQMLQGKKF